MNNANSINIPITTPVVRYPVNSIELLIRGYFSKDNKVYVIRHVHAGVMQVEQRQADFHLKGFWRVAFAISLIGPMICFLALALNYMERCDFHYKLVAKRPAIVKPVKVNIKEFDLMDVVRESIQRSIRAQHPLPPKLYMKNIGLALIEFIDKSSEKTVDYSKLKRLILDKELIIFEVLEALKVQSAEHIYKVLSESFDVECGILGNPEYHLRLCHKIIVSLQKGPEWLAQMNKAFCELIVLLPERLDLLKEKDEFKELQKVVKQISIDATWEVLFLPDLVKLKNVYDPVASLLGIEPMEIDKFIENDEMLAKTSV